MKRFLKIWIVIPCATILYTQILQPIFYGLAYEIISNSFPVNGFVDFILAGLTLSLTFSIGSLLYFYALALIPIIGSNNRWGFLSMGITYFLFFLYYSWTGTFSFSDAFTSINYVLNIITTLLITMMIISTFEAPKYML